MYVNDHESWYKLLDSSSCTQVHYVHHVSHQNEQYFNK